MKTTTSPSARDLPQDVKRRLLDELRNHPDAAPYYDEVVSQIGEDGLLDMALRATAARGSPAATPRGNLAVRVTARLARWTGTGCVYLTNPIVTFPVCFLLLDNLKGAWSQKDIGLPVLLLVVYLVALLTGLRRSAEISREMFIAACLYYPAAVLASLVVLIHALIA